MQHGDYAARMTHSNPAEQRDTKRVVFIFAVGFAIYLMLGYFLWWLFSVYVDPSAVRDPSKEATAKKGAR